MIAHKIKFEKTIVLTKRKIWNWQTTRNDGVSTKQQRCCAQQKLKTNWKWATTDVVTKRCCGQSQIMPPKQGCEQRRMLSKQTMLWAKTDVVEINNVVSNHGLCHQNKVVNNDGCCAATNNVVSNRRLCHQNKVVATTTMLNWISTTSKFGVGHLSNRARQNQAENQQFICSTTIGRCAESEPACTVREEYTEPAP